MAIPLLTFNLRKELPTSLITISFIMEIIVLILSMVTTIYAYKTTYGNLGISDAGVYMIGVMCISLVTGSIVFIVHLREEGLEYPLWFPVLLFFLFRIILALLPVLQLSGKHVDRLIDISFANWRVDTSYMFFEYDNECRGLAVVNDSCINSEDSVDGVYRCCDDLYKKSLKHHISTVSGLSITVLIFSIFILCAFILGSVMILKYALD